MLPAQAEPLNVVLAFDAKFSSHAGVALYSLLASNTGRRFNIHLLTHNLPAGETERFVRLGEEMGAGLEAHEIDSRRWSALPTTKRFPIATYFRFLIPDLFGSEGGGKVLYLDSDMVVNGDVGPLWDTDVSGVVAAVCKDIGCQKTRHAALRLSPSHHYFNTGMLLINLAMWRERTISERAIAFLTGEGKGAVYLDQDALNVCMQEQVAYVSCIWNFMPFLRYTRLQEDYPAIQSGALKPVIVHYAGNVKPWNFARESNPFMRLYWDYRHRSPWAHDQIV